MVDIIVGSIFFVLLGFALRYVYRTFKSGSCASCGAEENLCNGGASCPHCHPQNR